jgi:hypothetical protein
MHPGVGATNELKKSFRSLREKRCWSVYKRNLVLLPMMRDVTFVALLVAFFWDPQ